jgi:hypothetical protein
MGVEAVPGAVAIETPYSKRTFVVRSFVGDCSRRRQLWITRMGFQGEQRSFEPTHQGGGCRSINRQFTLFDRCQKAAKEVSRFTLLSPAECHPPILPAAAVTAGKPSGGCTPTGEVEAGWWRGRRGAGRLVAAQGRERIISAGEPRRAAIQSICDQVAMQTQAGSTPPGEIPNA